MKENPFFDKLLQKRSIELENMIQNPQSFTQQAIEAANYILEERSKCVDYSQYTYPDLIDVKKHINSEKYPVRAALLLQEISKRKRDQDFDSEKQKQRKESIRINPRLGISLKKRDNKLNEEIEITLEDFKGFMLDPTYGEYIKIEDSAVELFVIFDTDKNRHGFFLEYYDKYEKLEYRSRLHGLSENYTIEYLKNFLEKGKTELKTLDWVQIKKTSLLSLIISSVPVVLFLTLVISFHFKINPVYDLILEYRNLIINGFVYLFLSLSIYNVYSNLWQFKNLSKLTHKEKFDTISSIFIPIVLAGLIYFDLIPSILFN